MQNQVMNKLTKQSETSIVISQIETQQQNPHACSSKEFLSAQSYNENLLDALACLDIAALDKKSMPLRVLLRKIRLNINFLVKVDFQFLAIKKQYIHGTYAKYLNHNCSLLVKKLDRVHKIKDLTGFEVEYAKNINIVNEIITKHNQDRETKLSMVENRLPKIYLDKMFNNKIIQPFKKQY